MIIASLVIMYRSKSVSEGSRKTRFYLNCQYQVFEG